MTIFTKEHISEYQKCLVDIAYFAEEYIKIMHPMKGVTSIELNDMQLDFIQQYMSSDQFTEFADRQTGKTTVEAIIMLHQLIMKPDQIIGVLSPNQRMGQHVLETIVFMFGHLPDWLKTNVHISRQNKNSLQLSNGSQIDVSSTLDRFRGRAISSFCLDEFDFIHEDILNKFMVETYIILCTGNTKVYGLSTSRTKSILKF